MIKAVLCESRDIVSFVLFMLLLIIVAFVVLFLPLNFSVALYSKSASWFF